MRKFRTNVFELDITWKCNLACANCTRRCDLLSPGPDMTPEFFEKQLYGTRHSWNAIYIMGGEPTLENCEVLCVNCDSEQTYKKDIPAIAKSKRIIDKRLTKKPRSITGWKNFRGEPIRASRER